MFDPERPVWTVPVMEDWHRRFVQEADETKGKNFEDKLENQLKDATLEVHRLVAELLYIHLLPAGWIIKAPKKRWLSELPLRLARQKGLTDDEDLIPPDLGAGLDQRVLHPGPAFNSNRFDLMAWLLNFVLNWWREVEESSRIEALGSFNAFKRQAELVPGSYSAIQRSLLYNLLFPADYPPIVSADHKRRIVRAFTQPGDPHDSDTALGVVYRRVKAQPDFIDFYHRPYLDRWEDKATASPWGALATLARRLIASPAFKQLDREPMLSCAGEARPVLDAILAAGDAASAGHVDSLRDVISRYSKALTRLCRIPSWTMLRSQSDRFGQLIQELLGGKELTPRVDTFAETYSDTTGLKGHGMLASAASFFLSLYTPTETPRFGSNAFNYAIMKLGAEQWGPDSSAGEVYTRAMTFLDEVVEQCAQREVTLEDRLDAQGIVLALFTWRTKPASLPDDLWREIESFRKLVKVETPPDDVGETVVVPKPESEDPIEQLLLKRHNVLLYGPPGTGKTYRTIQIAERWVTQNGPDSVWQVTFHPSYAYEDFIEGYRPDESGKFVLRPGLFVQAARAAASHPDQRTLLVIDELNRGDVARLFGELITLIEADKRHLGVARRLPYSQESFWVPPNLYLLGTMNTADRSISLLDIAIRRRFCFVEFPPDPKFFDSADGYVRSLDGLSLGQVLEGLNRRLQEAGVDRDRAVGHAHLLARIGSTSPLRGIADRFRYDIVPLIEEYCYADRGAMRRVLGHLVDEAGRTDEGVFASESRFIKALRDIAGLSPRDETGDLPGPLAEAQSQDGA